MSPKLQLTLFVRYILCALTLIAISSAFSFMSKTKTAFLTSSDLFISEYVEGSSNNKALEFYNGTSSVIDLSAEQYIIQMYFNGSSTPATTINLIGTVNPNDVFVLANSSAVLGITADQVDASSWYNGDDAIVLRKGGTSGTIIDAIGQVGFDPGTEWGTGLTSTADNTLRRKSSICKGDLDASNSFDPALEYDGFAINTFEGLGSHVSSCGTGPNFSLTATEFNFSSTVGSPSSVQAYKISGSGLVTDLVIRTPIQFEISLIPEGPYTDSLSISASSINSGAIEVYLRYNPTIPGPHSGNVTHTSGSLSKNILVNGFTGITPIYVIQGNGSSSTLVGSLIKTSGIVVGDFQGTNQLKGFFIQDRQGDGDSLTSDGIFVYDTTYNVHVGDVVELIGKVEEYFNLTEIKEVTSVVIDSVNIPLPAAKTIHLPTASTTELESVEGMRVTFPQILTVSENYNLARYGEVILSSDGRLLNPTNFIDANDDPPSGNSSSGNSNVAAIAAQQNLNNLRSITLDDDGNVENPSVVPYIDTLTKTLRTGSTIQNLTGVIEYAFSKYRVRPTNVPTFNYAQRPAVPAVGSPNVKVASFNVLNYFNGNGVGGGFPTPRGATTIEEFNRQRAKIIEALKQLNADVIGLMEMENDGDDSVSAIADLVKGINTSIGATTYGYVLDPKGENGNPGSDAIKVALIFKLSIVDTVGSAKADTNPINNRNPLAQIFNVISSGEKFTVIVNHFKSKNCDTSAPAADQDQGDGQSCFNDRRKQQAFRLLNFIDTLQSTSGIKNVITLGDLNSYEQEDPIDILKAGGLINLISDNYSFVYQAQSGSLDHALVTSSLLSKVTGAEKWHVNADEPRFLDYNQEFNPVSAYNAGPYRSSDHDPVLIGLNLQKSDSITCTSKGFILREVFSDIYGGLVYDLTLSPRFPNNPSASELLTTFESRQNSGDRYGDRISGFICPPETGYYTFFISGDDNSQLWLSSDDTRANRKKIAGVPAFTDFREYNKYGSQKALPIYLKAGQKYYIEALHKEGVGPDHVSVGWTLPSGITETPISGSRLSPYTLPASLESNKYALDFDGTQYVKVKDTLLLNFGTGDFTFEATIQPVNQKDEVIISKRGPHNEGFIFLIFNNNLLIQLAGSNYQVPVNLNDGNCHHIAAKRKGTIVKLFVDGQVKGVFLSNKNISWNQDLYIGWDPRNLGYNGKIGEVRIWNFSRTDAEINEHSKTALSGTEAGLIALYEFREGNGQLVNDKTSNDNDGTMGSTFNVENSDPIWANAICLDRSFFRDSFESPKINSSLISTVRAYPNPFEDEIKIKLEGDANEVLKVIINNIQGVEVFSSYVNNGIGEIVLGRELKEGIYIVRIIGNNKLETFKIIKTTKK